jgi:hypothetical protein
MIPLNPPQTPHKPAHQITVQAKPKAGPPTIPSLPATGSPLLPTTATAASSLPTTHAHILALYSSPNGEQQEAARPPTPPGSQANTASTWSGFGENSGNLWGRTDALEVKAVAENLIHKDVIMEDGRDKYEFLQKLCKTEEKLYLLAKLVKAKIHKGKPDAEIIRTMGKLNLMEEKFNQLTSEGPSILSEQVEAEAQMAADENKLDMIDCLEMAEFQTKSTYLITAIDIIMH